MKSSETRSPTARFRVFYGSSPLHLLGMLLCFALVAYVVATVGVSALWNPTSWWQSILVWFVGAALLHDFVLFPLYALADRVGHTASEVLAGRRRRQPARVSVHNYLRLPALASGLLFVMFFPGIIEQGASSYHRATGQTQAPFLQRWVLLVVLIFVLSALAYAIAWARAPKPVPTPADESSDAG
ncbi:MAG: hypothetical protein ACR2FG_00395 [Marmoricola sp.]